MKLMTFQRFLHLASALQTCLIFWRVILSRCHLTELTKWWNVSREYYSCNSSPPNFSEDGDLRHSVPSNQSDKDGSIYCEFPNTMAGCNTKCRITCVSEGITTRSEMRSVESSFGEQQSSTRAMTRTKMKWRINYRHLEQTLAFLLVFFFFHLVKANWSGCCETVTENLHGSRVCICNAIQRW